MSYDYRKLCGKIKEKYGTQEKFSKELGLSRTTVNQKLNNKIEFTQEEMTKTVKILDLAVNDIPEYFFCVKSLEN
ncbi:DUF739 family protein [Clostridium sp.]|uniref:DUF739 family protein n=1 Tax=Clostridium sp. TaxID=1506 RepID=UPI001DA928EA|nr:DUF739 family protein [Clostridium sp.]MBS5308773.1 DUF739 family protein [Clostridium sp.]